MSITLRPYQVEASDAVLREFSEVTSTLVVKPTGCGKTILFADVIRRMRPQRAMVLAHREELIWQGRDKIERCTGLTCEIEMANFVAASNLFAAADVVISTVQTQNSGPEEKRRMTRFDPKDFGLLIIDEAHHATSPSYRRCIDYYTKNPDLRVLGVTATPDRTDEEALGQIFQTVAFDYEILDAIHDGWLVPIEQQMVSVSGLDYSQVKTTAGDLNGAELAAIMEREHNMQKIASASIELVGNKRAIAFCTSKVQAETLHNIFNRHKNNMAAFICDATAKPIRREILKSFSEGVIQVVCNCGVLNEGFDDPGVEVIIMGRPTKSRSLYAQMCGRSTRPLPNIVDGIEHAEERKRAIAGSAKPTCLIVDFSGNAGRHKLITSADILGGKVSEEAIEKAKIRAEKEGKAVLMSALLDEEQEKLRLEAERRRREEEAKKARLVARSRYTTRIISPFDVLGLEPAKQRGWDGGRVLSEKQRNVLLNQGIDPDSMPYAQGKQLVGEICQRYSADRCSFKQARKLKEYGYPIDVSRAEAHAILDKVAANGWRRPPGEVSTSQTKQNRDDH